ncbi:TPA: hypothetical protein O4G03_003909 [Proteus mirabilis]|uniref:hypothetical protein n=1 Tax=Proteus TaxID=583 RepID=UPI0002833828|nr:hypothetical protein [Proteus mirabilis]EJG2210104.1 hypothetical protein [Proteus mirabilis]EKA98676.1 hypothetical protein HMPREF1310_01238 [Proteus mirabilis WGLW4]ELA7789397.1 hypothetical protein [Proteus mirabilis]MBG3138022.1 hypothetical protein [Proteus mirabilis]MDL4004353.1 hypothetical protein [Proteus mirabilis]
MSRRSYLPDDLPHNRALWPEEYRELEQLDLLASRLIRQLKNQKIHRTRVLVEIEKLTEVHREFFRDRLNYWREVMKS